MAYVSNDNGDLKVLVYRDWKGLNMTNSWWKDHDFATLTNVENICPDLVLLDMQTNPSISNVYTNDPGVDGSRFEYNNLQKTTIKLRFLLHWSSYEDYFDKKHDIQSFFAAKARFLLKVSYHPFLTAACYTSKVDMNLPEDHAGLHDLVFTVELDNALGCWYTNQASWMYQQWRHGDESHIIRDLRLPRSVVQQGPNALMWDIHEGESKIYQPGDFMIQLSNPEVECVVKVEGVHADTVSIENKTTNTQLVVKNDPQSGLSVPSSFTWSNLDLTDEDGNHINQLSNSLDFWIDPGWNDIIVSGASRVTFNPRFYFTTL